MTDLPKRFTPEQVLAVFPPPGAKPMSTVQVAKAVREANGAKFGEWRDDVTGNADVAKALKALVDDGRLVTSRAKTYGKPWDPSDQENAHLLDPDDAVSRFYATPEQSKAWQEKVAAYWLQIKAANVLTKRLDETGRTQRVGVHRGRDYSDPTIGVTLTIEQAALIVDLIEADVELNDDDRRRAQRR